MRVVCDYLQVASDLPPDLQLELRARLSRGGRGKHGPWRYTARTLDKLVRVRIDPRTPGTPWAVAKALLTDDHGREQSRAALASLGALVAAVGGLDSWHLTRVDVAVDYPLWLWDVLVTRPRFLGHLIGLDEPTGPPTMKLGTRGESESYTTYWRGFRGESLTRLEASVHPSRGGITRTLADLPGLVDPFAKVAVRPMWGPVPLDIAVALRSMQQHGWAKQQRSLRDPGGLVPTGYPVLLGPAVVRPDRGASKKARERAWSEVVAAAQDPAACALIMQPSEALRIAWPSEADRMLRALGLR